MYAIWRSKTVLLVSGFLVMLILLASLISPNFMSETFSQNEFSNNPISEQQNSEQRDSCLVANLTAQITELKNEIIATKLALEEKTAESSNWKKQALDLSKAMREIESQLECLQKSEQLYDLVDRLRASINQTGDEP